MSTLERIYQIDQMLAGRQAVSRRELQEKLGISCATFKRDLAYMQDRLHAPIIYDRKLHGYRYEKHNPHIGPTYALPGLWFNAAEIHALLMMQHLLANLDTGGLLGPHIQPLLARLSGLIETGDSPAGEVQKRVRIVEIGARQTPLTHFQSVATALLKRKRLFIHYRARSRDTVSEREISPQRLVHYRDSWYLDAWCHTRNALRTFSVDAIVRTETLTEAAKDLPDKLLDAELGSAYGIISGKNITWAILRFTPKRARWVSAEKWHPRQKGRKLADGAYELRIPYSDDRELIMDILKYGGDCCVVGPEVLRERVMAALRRGLEQYSEGDSSEGDSGE